MQNTPIKKQKNETRGTESHTKITRHRECRITKNIGRIINNKN